MKKEQPKKQWYVATLIVTSFVKGKQKGKHLFDRQVRIIRAASNEEAYQKALSLGKEENASYRNPRGEKVSWRFLGLEDLRQLLNDHLDDGTEIISWLDRGDPRSCVRLKQQLGVFWYEANKNKTAGELLAKSLRSYVPATRLGRRK